MSVETLSGWLHSLMVASGNDTLWIWGLNNTLLRIYRDKIYIHGLLLKQYMLS